MDKFALGDGLAVRMLLLSELLMDVDPFIPRSRAGGRTLGADMLPDARALNMPPLLTYDELGLRTDRSGEFSSRAREFIVDT